MTKNLCKSLILILIAFCISCSREYYVPTTTESAATVSFCNLSPDVPDIYIVSGCTSLPIKSELIESKKPNDAETYRTAIKANQVITIKVVNNWIIKEKTDLVYTGGGVFSIVDTKITKYTTSCDSQVSFVPEENKHYEVYFGLIGEECKINVSESVFSKDSNKVLLSVPSVKVNECSK